MKKIYILLLFLLPLFALTCESPEPELPPITQTGENTFGCLVDGEVYLPKGSFNKPALTSSWEGGTFGISSHNTKLDSYIYITI